MSCRRASIGSPFSGVEACEIMTAADSQSSLSYCSLPRVTPSWSRANQLPNDSTRSTCPTPVMNSRRQFLIQAPVALLGAVTACRVDEQKPGAGGTTSAAPTPGAPPAFNTAPPVGPEVSPATFSEAEKLVQGAPPRVSPWLTIHRASDGSVATLSPSGVR